MCAFASVLQMVVAIKWIERCAWDICWSMLGEQTMRCWVVSSDLWGKLRKMTSGVTQPSLKYVRMLGCIKHVEVYSQGNQSLREIKFVCSLSLNERSPLLAWKVAESFVHSSTSCELSPFSYRQLEWTAVSFFFKSLLVDLHLLWCLLLIWVFSSLTVTSSSYILMWSCFLYLLCFVLYVMFLSML